MAVFYRLYQMKRENSKFNDKWYGRAYHTREVTLTDLAKIIEQNCTVKKADVLAVLSELSVSMQRELLNGSRVRLDGIGIFKICISTLPSDKLQDWTVAKNIRRSYINFKPETSDKYRNGTKTRTINMLNEVKFERYHKEKNTNTDDVNKVNSLSENIDITE